MTSFTQLTIDPELDRLLRATVNASASDLHLTLGRPPMVRLSGDLIPIEGMSDLGAIELDRMIGSLMDEVKTHEFAQNHQVDFSFGINGVGRFRANAFRQRGCMALALRVVPHRISPLDELGAPAACSKLLNAPYGLVLVVGPTGSGKSTTLAAMIDQINRDRACHILTIEDPIEYYHEHKSCVVTQREVGVDTENYAVALKNALRQRPDVILVGEIRDREVMEQALTASETGHLCLATIHTNNSYQAIERIVNLFNEDMHQQIRLNLATNLRAILSQRLVPTKAGGMTVALEVMLNQGLVKELILEGKITKIREVMEANQNLGMCTFDQSLIELFQRGIITEEVALSQSDMPGDMKIRLQQARLGGESAGLSGMDTSLLTISE